MVARPGIYRRRIRLVGSPGEVDAEMEDDFHRFRVVLGHDGRHVTRVAAEGRRIPWTTCADATQRLRALEGMPLSLRCTAVGEHDDPRQNCTHQFDLAGLAVAHAARMTAGGDPRRQYDVRIAHLGTGPLEPVLERDGRPLLAWKVEGMGTILEPPAFKGVPLRGRFQAWAEANLDPDLAEAAIVLRRAITISHGRLFDFEAVERASEVGNMGTCFTFQPGTAEQALRLDTRRDFTHDPDQLLA